MESDDSTVGEHSTNKPLFSGYRDSKTVYVKDPCIIKKDFSPNSSASSEDENNDEIPEEEDIIWKRKKKNHSNDTLSNDGGVKFREMAMEFQQSRTKETSRAGEQSAYKENAEHSNKRRNNIWGNVLMEQSLTDTIYGVGVEHTRGAGNREVETYEYWLKNRPTQNSHISIPPENIRKRKKAWPFYYHKDEPDDKFARRLARRLKEPKYILIGNVIRCIGRKLALELLYSTEEIEATGGLMTVDQSRRKTPGGVYLHLLKNHPDVSKEQLNIIFEEDKRQFEQQKKKSRKLKKCKRKRLLKKQMENDYIMDDPPLPSVVDVALKEAADLSAICTDENGKTVENMMDSANSDKESGEIEDTVESSNSDKESGEIDDTSTDENDTELPKSKASEFKNIISTECDNVEME